MALFKRIDLKGDAFASFVTFFIQAVVKFGSSMILTRVLRPDDYGIVAIMTSVAVTLALLSDLGTHVCIVRSPHGDSPVYLNTAWTLRLCRGLMNAVLIWILAPVFAGFYSMPSLVGPLRWFALWFVVDGLASNAYLVATRRKNTRIIVYCDLAANVISTLFSIVYCFVSRTFWGMVYGMILGRAIYALLSYAFYRDQYPRLQYDRSVAREIFQFTRVVMPSSILTLVIGQFDRTVFLRLFDLRLLGLYGLASNLAAQAEGLVSKMSEMVIYPRCANNFRLDRENFGTRFYQENARVFAANGALVGMLGGGSGLIITLLYDPRYSTAAGILAILTLRGVLTLYSAPAESLLLAAGDSQILIVGNVLRAIFIVIGAFAGYRLAGFNGFVAGMALSGLPTILYYFWRQHRLQALKPVYEFYRLAYVAGVAFIVYLVSSGVMTVFHVTRIHFRAGA